MSDSSLADGSRSGQGAGVEEHKVSRRWLMGLLVGFPAWLGISIVGGWWIWERQYKAGEEGAKLKTEITPQKLEDTLEKIRNYATPRGAGTEGGREGLTRMAAMIESSLGPANAGYPMRRLQGVGDWPVLEASLRGDKRAPLWVVCPYDDPDGTAGPSSLASTLAAARSLVGRRLGRPVKFLFLPDRDDPELAGRVAAWMAPEPFCLWVENTAGESLRLEAGPAHASQPESPLSAAPASREWPAYVGFAVGAVHPDPQSGLAAPTRMLANIIRNLAK